LTTANVELPDQVSVGTRLTPLSASVTPPMMPTMHRINVSGHVVTSIKAETFSLHVPQQRRVFFFTITIQWKTKVIVAAHSTAKTICNTVSNPEGTLLACVTSNPGVGLHVLVVGASAKHIVPLFVQTLAYVVLSLSSKPCLAENDVINMTKAPMLTPKDKRKTKTETKRYGKVGAVVGASFPKYLGLVKRDHTQNKLQ